ncbi:MAG TPA: hypothetical protein VMP11_19220 [Verrucomicrobiae bacterium]|nr:hypothetical protein [Verrucomicrobiae bacterium]
MAKSTEDAVLGVPERTTVTVALDESEGTVYGFDWLKVIVPVWALAALEKTVTANEMAARNRANREIVGSGLDETGSN